MLATPLAPPPKKGRAKKTAEISSKLPNDAPQGLRK
jgi:hypothetical protein